MKFLRNLLLSLLCLTGFSTLFPIVIDYRHFKVAGKDVYLLGDLHTACKTDKSEAEELLHYLFSSDNDEMNKMTCIVEGNRDYLQQVYRSSNWINADGRINSSLGWKHLLQGRLMLSIVRSACFLYPVRVNNNVSIVQGDCRGPGLMQYLLDGVVSHQMSLELVQVRTSIIKMILDERVPVELQMEITQRLKDILSFIDHDIALLSVSDSVETKADLKKNINDLVNLYFYAHIHTALLKDNKVVLYAGAAHTEAVSKMLQGQGHELARVVQQDIHELGSLVMGLGVSGGVGGREKISEINYEKQSIISEFLPKIFGITVDESSRSNFLYCTFYNRKIGMKKRKTCTPKAQVYTAGVVIALSGILGYAVNWFMM